MWIRIVDIDFVDSSINVEVVPPDSEEFFARMYSFASKCRALRLGDIRLCYQKGISKNLVKRLKDFCCAEGLEPPGLCGPDSDSHAVIRSTWSTGAHTTSDGEPRITYQLSFNNLDSATTDLSTAVMLIGESIDLDPRSRFKLRLCLYELAINTVEHGTFTTDCPIISVLISFTGNRVTASYSDNADLFLAESPSTVDLVKEQIASSSKRGLGLYILTKICDDWKYKRAGDWNVTTFELETGQITISSKER